MATTKKKTAAVAKKPKAKLENFATAPINKSLSKDEKIDLYRTIVGIRQVDIVIYGIKGFKLEYQIGNGAIDIANILLAARLRV